MSEFTAGQIERAERPGRQRPAARVGEFLFWLPEKMEKVISLKCHKKEEHNNQE
jgi:hypothetical protein